MTTATAQKKARQAAQRLTTAEKIINEVQRMAGAQAIKVLTSIHTNKDAERVLATLVSRRHHRRTRRLMQKASRRGNR